MNGRIAGVCLGIFLAVILFSSPAYGWISNTTCDIRYPIDSNATAVVPLSVNDTSGVDNNIVWTFNASASAGEKKFLYYISSSRAFCGVGNDTHLTYWENETDAVFGGNNPKKVWDNSSTLGVWHFWENTGTKTEDSTPNRVNLTFTNSPTWTAGRFGRGINFVSTSSQYLVSPQDYTNRIGSGDFTVLAWVKPASFPTSGTRFVYQVQTSPTNAGFLTGTNDGKTVRADVFYNDGTATSCVGNSMVEAGKWYFYALVRRGSNIEVWLNDSFVTCAATTKSIAGSGSNLYIGSDRAPSTFFDGVMDEVRIYSRALSQSELKELFYNGMNNLTSIGPQETANQAPTFSNITVSPSSPQTYPIAQTHFNITWSDADGISKAWIRHNFTGAFADYAMINDTAVSNSTLAKFYYFLNDTKAGTFVYTFFANDTKGATNSTQQFVYIVNKANTTIKLAINGTEDNVTGTYPYPTNTTAWKTVGNGNIILLRNGTLVNSSTSLDAISEVIKLGVGVHNYTAVLDHDNYTAPAITRFLTINKADSQLSLTSSAEWNINEGTATTITCTAVSPLTVTLIKDGVVVPNPYTSILPFGAHTFVCTISDTQNYTPTTSSNVLNVMISGTGCIKDDLYIYTASIPVSAPQVVLNFTNLARQNIVKDDLSDINVTTPNTSSSVFINSTEKFFLVNSTNVSSFTINFGNYFTKNSYLNTSLSNQTVTNFNYSQLAPAHYTVNILNEINASALYPVPNATLTFSMYCSNGANSFNITQPRFSFPTLQQLKNARMTVTYTPTSVYYRDLIVSAPISPLNFYLLDALQYQVVQMIINLQDNTNEFSNANLQITKILGGQSVTITQLPFDVEKKAVIYLQNGGTYQIYVSSGTQTRGIGELFVDNVNLIKTIVINPLFPIRTFDNVTWNLTMDNTTGVITFFWFDPLNKTNRVNMTIYNQTDNNQVAFFTSTNSSLIIFSYYGNVNTTYRVEIAVDRSPPMWITRVLSVLGAAVLPIVGFPSFPANFLFTVSAIAIASSAMIFDQRNGALAAIIASIVAIAAIKLGWYPLSITIAVVVLFLAIMNKLAERRRVGEE